MPNEKDVKIFSDENWSEAERAARQSVKQAMLDGAVVNKLPPDAGIYGTDVPEPTLNYKKSLNEKVIKKGNAYIVLGRDRSSSDRSAYGGKGAQNANCIDIVVGRMKGARSGKGVKDGTYVDSRFSADAARVYISELTDIDVNFGLATGQNGSQIGRSGIGIKADGIRIMSRDAGIKIVTGRMQGVTGFGNKGETNTLGGKQSPAPPIELIAGNNDGVRTVAPGVLNPILSVGETINYLQGVAMGENTRDAFKDLSKIVDEIWSAVFNLALIQGGYNAVIGVDPIRPWVPSGASAASVQNLTNVVNSLHQTRASKVLWQINHFDPWGYKPIVSKNVFTT